MSRPTLTKSNEVIFRTQKSHWVGKHNNHHISVINAPDDIPSKPWRTLIWTESDDDPTERGELLANFRHYSTLQEALNTAIRRIGYRP